MQSIRNRGIALVAIAMLALVGCGKEKPADMENDAWSMKTNDVQLKLAEVKKQHEALNTQIYTMPAAASTDSAVVAERTAIEMILNDDAKRVGEIETMLNDDMTSREKLKAEGGDAYKSAWASSEPEYNEAMKALDSMQNRYGDLKNRVDNLAKIAAAPGDDTTAGTEMQSMPEMKDSGATGNIDTGAKIR